MSQVDPAPTGRTTPGDQGQDDVATLTRFEEQQHVGVQTEAVRRLRLRKQIVTEEVTRTVTVRREELVVDEGPVEPGTGAGHTVGDRDLEIVLHEERVEVRTVVVPVERVTVRVRRVTGRAEVSEVVRREQIDLDTTEAGGA